jgi:hypothetical protein
MPAPRACRSCGAALPVDIRWCTRCYEPVRELTPRAPIHEGDFVGSPVHERGDIPRWSRWKKTATTFGPRGRLVATALLLLTILPAISLKGIVYLVTFPFFAAVVPRRSGRKGGTCPTTPHGRAGTSRRRRTDSEIADHRLEGGAVGPRLRGVDRVRVRPHRDQVRRSRVRRDRPVGVALEGV